MCVVAEPRAVDVRSSHQFEEEIGAASQENQLFIAKTEFSVRTGGQSGSLTIRDCACRLRVQELAFKLSFFQVIILMIPVSRAVKLVRATARGEGEIASARSRPGDRVGVDGGAAEFFNCVHRQIQTGHAARGGSKAIGRVNPFCHNAVLVGTQAADGAPTPIILAAHTRGRNRADLQVRQLERVVLRGRQPGDLYHSQCGAN